MENINKKLHRVLDEIQKTEEKIAAWQEHLGELNIQKEMLEEAEIIKSIRSMRLGSRELLSVLEGVQSGTVIFSEKTHKAGGPSDDGSREPEMAGNAAEDFSDGQGLPQGTGLEREDLEDEREN